MIINLNLFKLTRFWLEIVINRKIERPELKCGQEKKLMSTQRIRPFPFCQSVNAVAEMDIPPRGIGRVFYGRTSCKAISDGDSLVPKGQQVLVVERIELTLRVIPLASK